MGVLLMAVFLVNLPFVHQTWTDRRWSGPARRWRRSGRRAAAATATSWTTGCQVGGPRARPVLRPGRQATFERAEETDGARCWWCRGSRRRTGPAGESATTCSRSWRSSATWCCSSSGVALYRRWRQRLRLVVAAVDGDEATLDTARGPVTVAGPPGWAARVRLGQDVRRQAAPGRRPRGGARGAVGGLEQVRGSSYVVKGRVVDARAGRLVLELDGPDPAEVETGRTGSAPTSATRPRSAARSASPRRGGAPRRLYIRLTSCQNANMP